MAHRPIADVIVFPRRVPRDDGAERLQRAVAALEAAVAAQRVAVAEWRGTLAQLKGSVRALEGSLADCAGRLEAVQGEVRQAGGAFRALEHWADAVLADQPSKPRLISPDGKAVSI